MPKPASKEKFKTWWISILEPKTGSNGQLMKQCQLWNFRKRLWLKKFILKAFAFPSSLLNLESVPVRFWKMALVSNHATFYCHQPIRERASKILKHRFDSSSLLPNSECFNINQIDYTWLVWIVVQTWKGKELILRSKIPVPNSIPNCIAYLEKIFRKISKNQIFEVCCDVDEQFYRTICLSWSVLIKNI